MKGEVCTRINECKMNGYVCAPSCGIFAGRAKTPHPSTGDYGAAVAQQPCRARTTARPGALSVTRIARTRPSRTPLAHVDFGESFFE